MKIWLDFENHPGSHYHPPTLVVVQILVNGVINQKVEVMIEIALEVVLEGGVVDADKQVNTNSKGK